MSQDYFSLYGQRLWPHIAAQDFHHDNYADLRRHFEASERAIVHRRQSLGHMTTPELCAIIDQVLRQPAGATSSPIVGEGLASRQHAIAATHSGMRRLLPEDVATRCLDVALSLIATIDVRTAPSGRRPQLQQGSSTLTWNDDSSFSDTLSAHFSREDSQNSTKTGRIDPNMTIPHLCKFKGFKVLWTSNLADHLHINWKSRIITIYEHKIVLWNYLQVATSPASSQSQTVIPQPILEEAIDTLNLLFPFDDPLTKQFLRDDGKVFNGLAYCGRARHECLDLGKFDVWKDRIAGLMVSMNEEPKGLRQLLLESDGRNLLGFVTFWVATAVAVLALANIPLGILSVYFTAKQYYFGVAVACLDPEVAAALPQYCR